jgi:hypothetical protein
MSDTSPIACTLSASELPGREAELRALGSDGLVDVRREAGRVVLRFRPDPEIRARVEAIVAAESECCAFLDFRVEHEDAATVLTISAPNGGAEVVHELAVMLGGR